MSFDTGVLIFLLVALLVALAGVLLFLHRRNLAAAGAPATANEFVFSTPQDTNRQKFVYSVAGLIKAATGLETHVVALGKQKHLDIEVHRGMRCVGVVSVVAPGEQSASERIHSIVAVKEAKRAKTAYVVTGEVFTDKQRKMAQRVGVTLLDGKALKRIERKAEVGGYVRRAAPPPEPDAEQAKRWRAPDLPAAVHPAAAVEPSLEVTKERRFKLPPWVEFR